MKKTTSMTLIILAFVLLFSIFILKRSDFLGKSGKEESFRPNFKTEEIREILITGKDEKVILNINNGKWEVPHKNDYPADFLFISKFINDILAAKIVRKIDIGAKQYERLKLDIKFGGLEFVLRDFKGNVYDHFIFGVPHFSRNEQTIYSNQGQVATGVYIFDKQNNDVKLISGNFSYLSDKTVKWLDHEFIKFYAPIENIKMEFFGGVGDWELQLSQNGKKMDLVGLSPNEQINIEKIRTIYPFFSNCDFVDLVEDEELNRNSQLHGILHIRDLNLVNYKFFIGTEMDENRLCKVKIYCDERAPKEAKAKVAEMQEFETRIYLIANSILAPFLQRRGDLIRK